MNRPSRALLVHAKPHKRSLAAVLLPTLAGNAVSLVQPLVIQHIVSGWTPEHEQPCGNPAADRSSGAAHAAHRGAYVAGGERTSERVVLGIRRGPGREITALPALGDEAFHKILLDCVPIHADRLVGPPGGAWPMLSGSISCERTGFAYLARAEVLIDLAASVLPDSALSRGAVVAFDDALAEEFRQLASAALAGRPVADAAAVPAALAEAGCCDLELSDEFGGMDPGLALLTQVYAAMGGAIAAAEHAEATSAALDQIVDGYHSLAAENVNAGDLNLARRVAAAGPRAGPVRSASFSDETCSKSRPSAENCDSQRIVSSVGIVGVAAGMRA